MGSDPEEEGQGRTACTPAPGCSEAGQACGADEVYGLYAGAIRDGVANCADYLDRIVRQMEGVPSRHYVAERAQALRAAAGGLVGDLPRRGDLAALLRQAGPLRGQRIYRRVRAGGRPSW